MKKTELERLSDELESRLSFYKNKEIEQMFLISNLKDIEESIISYPDEKILEIIKTNKEFEIDINDGILKKLSKEIETINQNIIKYTLINTKE